MLRSSTSSRSYCFRSLSYHRFRRIAASKSVNATNGAQTRAYADALWMPQCLVGRQQMTTTTRPSSSCFHTLHTEQPMLVQRPQHRLVSSFSFFSQQPNHHNDNPLRQQYRHYPLDSHSQLQQQQHLQHPPLDVFLRRIDFLQQHVLKGEMRPDEIDFCQYAIERLSKGWVVDHHDGSNNDAGGSDHINMHKQAPQPSSSAAATSPSSSFPLLENDEQRMRLADSLLMRLQDEVDQRQTSVSSASSASLPPQFRNVPTRCYIHVMRGWASLETPQALDRIFEIFQEDYQARLDGSDGMGAWSVYSAILYACGRCPHPEARAQADALMQNLETKVQQQQAFLPSHLYNEWILVHASKAATEYGAAAAAEDVLLHLSHLSTAMTTTTTTGNTKPPQLSFASLDRVIRAWTLSPEDKALSRAQEILQLLLHLSKRHGHLRPPSDRVFGQVIAAYGARGQAQEAEQILEMALQYFGDGGGDGGDDDDNGSSREDKAENKEEEPKDIQETVPTLADANKSSDNSSNSNGDSSSEKHSTMDLTEAFNALLYAWLQVDDPNKAVENIERLFSDIPTWLSSSNAAVALTPNATSYESRIQAHIRNGNVKQADTLLRSMMDAAEAEHYRIRPKRPEDVLFQTMMRAYEGDQEVPPPQWQEPRDNEDRPSVPVPPPTTKLCYGVLQAWLRSDPQQQQSRMDHMKSLLYRLLEIHKLYKPCAPTPPMFTMTVQVCCEEGNLTKAVDVLMRAETLHMTQKHAYGCIIAQLTQPPSADRGDRVSSAQVAESACLAAQLCRRMQDQQAEGWQHSSGLLISVLAALARAGNLVTAERADELLRHTQIPLSTRAYTCVLNAYTKVIPQAPESDELPRRVLYWFSHMQQLHQDPHSRVVLDEASFYTVLKALALTKNVEMAHYAEQVLAYMFQLHHSATTARQTVQPQQPHEFSLQPTQRCLEACIQAMLHSGTPDKAAALLQDVSRRFLGDFEYLPSQACFLQVAQECRKTRDPQLLDLAEGLEETAAHIF